MRQQHVQLRFYLPDVCDGGFVDLAGDLAFSSSEVCSAAAFVY